MIRFVQGDLLRGDVDVIAHQVNCQGVMGSGVARQVRELYPEAYHEYCRLVSQYQDCAKLLGTTQLVACRDANGQSIQIANLFGQCSFGRDGRQYTDYDALHRCLRTLKNFADATEFKRIGIPYHMGCGLGGGDWDTVSQIIQQELDGCDVTIFYRPHDLEEDGVLY